MSELINLFNKGDLVQLSKKRIAESDQKYLGLHHKVGMIVSFKRSYGLPHSGFMYDIYFFGSEHSSRIGGCFRFMETSIEAAGDSNE